MRLTADDARTRVRAAAIPVTTRELRWAVFVGLAESVVQANTWAVERDTTTVTLEVLQRLRGHGIRIAIDDDYGTGSHLCEDANDAIIVQSTIDMGRLRRVPRISTRSKTRPRSKWSSHGGSHDLQCLRANPVGQLGAAA